MTSTRTPKVRWYTCLILGAVWVWVLSWRFAADPIVQEVPLRYVSRSSGQTGSHPTPSTVTLRSIAAQSSNTIALPKRNIFAAGTMAFAVEPAVPRKAVHRRPLKPHVPAEPVALVPDGPSPEELARQAAQQQAALAEAAAKKQRELQIKVLKEQMGQFRYLGYLSRDGEHKAFLIKGNDIYIIRQGDTLEGKFEVSFVNPSTVTIREQEYGLETIMPLKKAPQSEPSA